MAIESTEAVTLGLLTCRLHDRFPTIPVSAIQQIVAEAYDGFDGCRIREFIPLLVERASCERLRSPSRQGVNAHTR
jgi:hypothetical protein